MQRLFHEARTYYLRLVVSFVLGAIAGLAPLALAPAVEFLKKFLDHDPAQHLQVLWLVIAALFLSNALGNLAGYASSYLSAWVGQRFIADLRVRLLQHALRLSVAEYDVWRPGDFLARFTSDLVLMTDAMSISLPQLIQISITLVGALVYLVITDWRLTLALLFVAPVVSFTVNQFTQIIAIKSRVTQNRIAEILSNLSDVLGAHRIVKAFHREEYETQRFQQTNEHYFAAYLKMTQMMLTQIPVVNMINVIAFMMVVGISAHEVIVGHMDRDSVFRYWTLVALAINPINRIAGYVGDLSRSVVGVARIYEILDLPLEEDAAIVMPSVEAAEQPIVGDIVFDHVRFSYPKTSVPILHDFSAHIQAGSVVAFVGPSGAGKTTIASLIPRFYDITAGEIWLDGRPLRERSLASLRNAIGIVPQDPQLFHGTIADNIRYGRLDATTREIEAAAQEANAAEFIAELPQGYETIVGERGTRLSGGQRQRIAIARAILRDPRIFILDEATSALDTHSERLIEEALETLLAGRTTIVIAHRLSTIRRADQIFYLDQGRLCEAGTHDDLLAAGGLYAALFAAQFS